MPFQVASAGGCLHYHNKQYMIVTNKINLTAYINVVTSVAYAIIMNHLIYSVVFH